MLKNLVEKEIDNYIVRFCALFFLFGLVLGLWWFLVSGGFGGLFFVLLFGFFFLHKEH